MKKFTEIDVGETDVADVRMQLSEFYFVDSPKYWDSYNRTTESTETHQLSRNYQIWKKSYGTSHQHLSNFAFPK